MFVLPVYMYLFVVALGTDYNILMIARLREQAAEGVEPRQAAAAALRHAGPAIGAAGLILAGTFASLTLAGNTILSQIGFAVSCGIALAAFVMAMFFSPALTALIGHRAWWRGHASKLPRANDPGLSPVRLRRLHGACPARRITARYENKEKEDSSPERNGCADCPRQQHHRLPGGAAGPQVLRDLTPTMISGAVGPQQADRPVERAA